MFSKIILKSLLFIVCVNFAQITYAQEIRVIDNKGTLKNVNNNVVTHSNTEPTTPLEGDIWFDTTLAITTIKIRDGNLWRVLRTGRSLFSVVTTRATPNVNVKPTDITNYSLRSDVLPTTTIAVQAGDIIDVRVNISEEFNVGVLTYDNIGDLLSIYATLNGNSILSQPTTIISGGDNSFEIAEGFLSRVFPISANGTLNIDIQIKFKTTVERNFSTDNSGVGSLQAIIYR
ncbi:hypothetical protein CW731_04100 [Polaribacter sp. ALD11]|uniref:hypothetical protein n=1 Tax=Polaribacter sp. ALD11 TaxID=2058137 RepID=UPI000C2FFEE5|nr:hypothetical protein [Polaribacter sp. ALD11]AUC84531.1 hypothetical protein CW731_04100 [Polaribacter sp. ALD11]